MASNVPNRTAFWAFAPYFVIWPIVLLGLLLEPMSKVWPQVFTEQTIALVWACSLIFVINAMGQEFPRGHFVFLFLLVVIAFLFMLYLGANHGEQWHYFRKLWETINRQQLRVSHDLLRFISWGLAIGYVWMFGETLLSQRYEATWGQIERHRFLFGPEYLRLSRDHPAQVVILDVFDWFLSFGGKWVIAYDSSGKPRAIGLVWGPADLQERLDLYMERTPTEEVD